MKYKPKEKKEKEIISFLDKKAKQGNFLKMSVEHLKNKFADKYYSEDDVEEVIDDLSRRQVLFRKTANMDIAYSKDSKDRMEKNFMPFFKTSIFNVFFFGFFAFLILFYFRPVFQSLYKHISQSPQEVFLAGSFLGVVGAYFLGKIMSSISKYLENKLPVLRNYKLLIYPVLLISLSLFGISFILTVFAPQLSLEVVAIISGSIGGGMAVGKLLFDEKKKKENK